MTSTVYLITGANRGVGFYLTQEIVKREDVVVFAGARNPEGATELAKLAKASENRVHAVKLDLGNKWDLDAVVKNIKEVAGKLDVVIGNAGICNVYGSPLEMTAQDMRDHFEVNTIGNLILFQKTYSLLQASSNPKFIVISATGGSITHGAPIPGLTAYGTSKAAVNYLTRRIHFEYEDLTAFSMCPGLVQSDMADFALGKGLDTTLVLKTGIETRVKIMEVINNATREKDGGTFTLFDGSRIPF